MSIALYIALGAVLAVLAAGAALVGIGGGAFYTPLQVLFGVDIHTAATTSLFLIAILSLSATNVYRRAGKIDWKLAAALEIFTIAGSFAGGYFSYAIPTVPLTIILTAALVAAGALMLHPATHAHEAHPKHQRWYYWKRTRLNHTYHVNLLIALPCSVCAGALSGLVGIGGGVVKVPLMVVLLGVPLEIAIATSAFMIGITAVGGFAGHAIAGHWDWRLSIVLAPGVFLGAWLGAHTMLRVRKDILRYVLGVFLLLIAAAVVARLIM